MAEFDWDDANIAHIAEHEIDPSEAEEAILGDAVYLGYSVKDGEDRFMQIGETLAGRVLVVIYTPRNALTRVVTAWPANRAYRKLYASERNAQYGNGEENSS
jgi:uncharacterized DUF497 family protein